MCQNLKMVFGHLRTILSMLGLLQLPRWASLRAEFGCHSSILTWWWFLGVFVFFLFCLWFSWLCTGCAMNHCDKSSKLVCFVYNQLNPQIPPFSKVTVFLIFSTSNLSYIIGVCSIWPHNLLSNITVKFQNYASPLLEMKISFD